MCWVFTPCAGFLFDNIRAQIDCPVEFKAFTEVCLGIVLTRMEEGKARKCMSAVGTRAWLNLE